MFLLFYYIFDFFLLFKCSCLHFPLTTLPCSTYTHLPHSNLPPFGFVYMSFITVPWWPFPYFPCYPLPPPFWLLSVLYFFFLIIFYCCSNTVVSISPPPLPLYSPPSPTLNTTLLWLCPWVPYTCSLMTLSFLSPIISLSLHLGYCQFVLYFNISGYILLAFLFCWLGSTHRWDHMVFVFHHLAYFT